VRFEPKILVPERAKTIHALNRAATVIRGMTIQYFKIGHVHYLPAS
jgi:hypothetical protein